MDVGAFTCKNACVRACGLREYNSALDRVRCTCRMRLYTHRWVFVFDIHSNALERE